jgi:hypothetical protein
MARDFLFIATVGQTDVQVVLPDPDGPHRYFIHKEHQRRFHLACLEGRIRWRMLSFEQAVTIPERRHFSLGLDEERHQLSSGLPPSNADPVEWDTSQGVDLCAPLLARCCRWLRDEGGLGRALKAVLLTTRRQPPEQSEPVGVFELVRAELARALGLPQEAVEEVTFVTEGDLYEADGQGQRHLKAEAGRKIDGALKRLRDSHPDAVAVISDVAGLPEAKAVLVASAQYRFREARFARPTEERPDTGSHRAVLIAPAESLATRAAVARLVRQGGFNEAAAIARHLRGEKAYQAEPWRRWLADAAGILEGVAPLNVDARLTAAPRSALCRCLLQLRRAGPTLAVAFRAEIALRRENWATALRETFTVAEIALRELAHRCLSRPGRSCLDWTRNQFYPEEAQGLSQNTQEYLAREHGDRKAVNFDYAPELERYLRQDLPDPARDALQAFDDAVRPGRKYRHVATHACLDESGIREVRDELEKSGVWPKGRPTCFLEGAPVQGLLSAAGQPDAATLYISLVEAVLDDMDAYSFQSP